MRLVEEISHPRVIVTISQLLRTTFRYDPFFIRVDDDDPLGNSEYTFQFVRYQNYGRAEGMIDF